MFAEKTVFILGAGASWHYGYPTGENLVRKVINIANSASGLFERFGDVAEMPDFVRNLIPDTSHDRGDIFMSWEKASELSKDLTKRLREVNPLVIDYFLGHNSDLQPIGKLMIAWAILACEGEFIRNEKRNPNRKQNDAGKDDWIRFILHELLNNCKSIDDLVSQNKVTFITFNYDTSLERSLYTRLCMIDRFKGKEDIIRKFLEDSVFHVYGKIHKNPYADFHSLFLEPNFDINNYRYFKQVIDMTHKASESILTIDPDDKTQNGEVLEKAQCAIKEAGQVYILGYGFDENNNKRLNLYNSLHEDTEYNKKMYFTNYGNSNRVNKAVGKIIDHNPDIFLPPNPFLHKHPLNHNFFYEKSTRNVYDALAQDF